MGKLPIKFEEFKKEPLKAILYMSIIALCFLYADGKMEYINTKRMMQKQVQKCEDDNYIQGVKIDKLREELLESKIAVSDLRATLKAFEKYNNQ